MRPNTDDGLSLQDIRARRTFGLGCLLVTGILLLGVLPYYFLGRVKGGLASSAWPKTTGILLKHDVISRGGRSRSFYAPVVEFEFSAGGERYRGKRLRFAPMSFPNPGDAWAYLRAFPVGAGVDVFYDPADPARSVLQPGITRREILASSSALILCEVIGMLLAVVLLRDRARMSKLGAELVERHGSPIG